MSKEPGSHETLSLRERCREFARWMFSDKGPEFRSGAGLPIRINTLTKASSNLLETQIGLHPTGLSHAKIAFVTLNVLFKTICMNSILRVPSRELWIKLLSFTLICLYDVGANLLLANDTFQNYFTKEDNSLELESAISVGVLNLAYLLYILYVHFSEKSQENQITQTSEPNDEIAVVISNPSEDTELVRQSSAAEDGKCRLPSQSWVIDELQLPLKFYLGVSAFFYGLMLGEKIMDKNTAPQIQIPLSMAFYGLMMAVAQSICDAFRGKYPNVKLCTYALICGPAEGFAYSACLIWLRGLLGKYAPILEPAAVGITTTGAIAVGGLLAHGLTGLCCNKANEAEVSTADIQPAEDSVNRSEGDYLAMA